MQKKLIFGISVSLIISILLIVTILFFGTQIATIIFCKITLSKHPVVYKVPEKITFENYSFTNITKLSCFDYEFELPWEDVSEKTMTQSLARILFKSGKGIAVFSPEISIDFAQTFRSREPKKAKLYYTFLGEKALRSDYDFYNTILRITPKDISLFKSPRHDIGATISLVLKSLFASNGNSGIYEFSNDNFRGFQFGAPSMSKIVALSVFNEKNKRLDFFLFDKKNENVDISQKEINFIISSIKYSTNRISKIGI